MSLEGAVGLKTGKSFGGFNTYVTIFQQKIAIWIFPIQSKQSILMVADTAIFTLPRKG